MIWVVALIVITCIGVSAILAWHNQAGVIAAFMGLAGTALGILSPSPLKQHGQNGASVDAGRVGTMNVQAAPSVADALPQAPDVDVVEPVP